MHIGQKSQAYLTQAVQFWWGNCAKWFRVGKPVGGMELPFYHVGYQSDVYLVDMTAPTVLVLSVSVHLIRL